MIVCSLLVIVAEMPLLRHNRLAVGPDVEQYERGIGNTTLLSGGQDTLVLM